MQKDYTSTICPFEKEIYAWSFDCRELYVCKKKIILRLWGFFSLHFIYFRKKCLWKVFSLHVTSFTANENKGFIVFLVLLELYTHRKLIVVLAVVRFVVVFVGIPVVVSSVCGSVTAVMVVVRSMIVLVVFHWKVITTRNIITCTLLFLSVDNEQWSTT